MKNRSAFMIIIMVLIASLACQTVFQSAPTVSGDVTPQATEASVASSVSPLAGLIYRVQEPDTGSSKYWQIRDDGEANNVVSGVFSPDGKKAAYTDFSDKCTWLIDYEKKEAKPLDCSSSVNDNLGLYTFNKVVGWMPGQPDKLLMLFDVSQGMGGGSGYFGAMSISNGEKEVLDSQHQVFSVTLSPDGKTVAYFDGYSYSGLYSPDTGIETFNVEPYGVDNFTLNNPTWSPDGKSMVWGLRDGNQKKDAIGIFNLENKTAQVLHPYSMTRVGLDGPVYAPRPLWSPDGKWVIFSAFVYDESGKYDTEHSGWWSLRSDGSAEYKLGGNFESWSTDGQWVIYWRQSENDPNKSDLMASRPDGTDAASLVKDTADGYQSIYPRTMWSPDGKHLVFVDDTNAVWMTEAGVWQMFQIQDVVLPPGANLSEWRLSLLTPYDQLTVFAVPTLEPASKFSCPNAPHTRLKVGDSARITFTNGKPTRLRSAPEAGDNGVDQLPEGTEFEIIGGPVCYPRPDRSDAYVYWEVNVPSRNVKGWLAEGDSSGYYIEPWP